MCVRIRDNFPYFLIKLTLWALIRIALVRRFYVIIMSTHNIGVYEEMAKRMAKINLSIILVYHLIRTSLFFSYTESHTAMIKIIISQKMQN